VLLFFVPQNPCPDLTVARRFLQHAVSAEEADSAPVHVPWDHRPEQQRLLEEERVLHLAFANIDEVKTFVPAVADWPRRGIPWWRAMATR
jgi:hypothetical protein